MPKFPNFKGVDQDTSNKKTTPRDTTAKVVEAEPQIKLPDTKISKRSVGAKPHNLTPDERGTGRSRG